MNKTLKQASLFTLLALPAILSSCGGGHENHASKEMVSLEPVSIKTTEAVLKDVPLFSETVGTIRSKNRASIAPKVTGEITSITVVPGQAVKKDELLVKISALEITSKLQSAQAMLDKARRDLRREEELLESNASTPEMVNDLKDQYRISQATVREAETFLSYTEVRAPFDGVITRKHTNEGDLSLPGHPMLELEDLTSLRVEADVPEIIGMQLTIGKEVGLVVSGQEKMIKGKVEEIAPAADPMSRTFPVKISIANDTKLRSGQFTKVRIPTHEVPTVLVESAAVTRWGQIERVFIVEEGRLHMRIVKTGSTHDGQLEVLSGLSGGETLAISAGQPLQDGASIR